MIYAEHEVSALKIFTACNKLSRKGQQSFNCAHADRAAEVGKN